MQTGTPKPAPPILAPAGQPSPEELRARLRFGWAAVAGAWREHADYVDTRVGEITEKMLELTAPQAGEAVLELACGPGSVGLAAAPRVGPTGVVVMSDVVPEMAQIAADRASQLGLRNVATKVLDLEDIAEPDETYDVVLCREGLMFALDPARAAREIHRVLRPRGRVAIAVWGPRKRNPWLGVVFDAVSAQTGMTLPPPGVPGPFALEDRDQLAAILRDGGLADVVVEEVPIRTHNANFDEWWSRTSALAGPLQAMLANLPEAASEAIRARLHEAVAPYRTAVGLDFPGMTLLASGRRA